MIPSLNSAEAQVVLNTARSRGDAQHYNNFLAAMIHDAFPIFDAKGERIVYRPYEGATEHHCRNAAFVARCGWEEQRQHALSAAVVDCGRPNPPLKFSWLP